MAKRVTQKDRDLVRKLTELGDGKTLTISNGRLGQEIGLQTSSTAARLYRLADLGLVKIVHVPEDTTRRTARTLVLTDEARGLLDAPEPEAQPEAQPEASVAEQQVPDPEFAQVPEGELPRSYTP